MKAALISIGTEITDGQIINSNATWISQELKKRGITVVSHHAVPDDFSLILQSLRYADMQADLLFVTGGLGPTSDDFTRDVIAKWCGRDLVFDSPSWQRLVDFLASLGREPHDIQKQQCYFPEGATIFENSKGTANAFSLSIHQNLVYVLPGPPVEIQAIWHDHIASQLDHLTANLDPLVTRSWDLLEISEPDAALITEKTITSPLITKGYRVHAPYVEVKLTYLRSQQAAFEKEIQTLDAALKKHTIARNGEDIAQLFLQKISPLPQVKIVDSLTQGQLSRRLGPAFYSQAGERSISNFSLALAENETRFEIHPEQKHFYKLSITTDAKALENILDLQHVRPERQRLVALEKALVFWMQNL